MANIPVNENDRLITVTATSNGQTDFDFDFLAFTGDQIAAIHIRLSDGVQTDLVHTADFTVTGLNNANGGIISLTGTPIAIGDQVVVFGDTPIQRISDFQQSGDFKADTVNTEEDLQTMMMQEMQRDIGQSLRVPLQNGKPTFEFSNGQFIKLKDDGSGFVGASQNLVVSEVDAWFQNRDTTSATQAALLTNGSIVSLQGLLYIVDSSATGVSSATSDLGVNGLSPFGTAFVGHYGVDSAGLIDQTANINRALSNSPHVVFPAGAYRANGDILFNSSQVIEVQKGATLTCYGGRITPITLGVNDVTIICDGEISSIGLVGGTTATAPRKFDWVELTSPDDGLQYAARGFIEFGGSFANRSSGFTIKGSGVIHGDWVGAVGDYFEWSQYPLKGIMANGCDDVHFEGFEVYGFVLEAVQHYDTNINGTVISKNVVFENLYVHDTAFSGLNFNHANAAENCFIRNNVVERCRHGIEISSGESSGNVVSDAALHCYAFGGAGRVDRVTSTDDTAIGSGDWAVLAFASATNAGEGKLRITNFTVDGAQRGGIKGGRMDIVIDGGNIKDYGQEVSTFLYEAINIDDTPSGTNLNKTLTARDIVITSDGPAVNTANVIYTDCPFPTLLNNVFQNAGKTTYLGRSTGFKELLVSPQTEYLETPFPGAANIGHSVTATMRVQPAEATPKSDYARLQYFISEYAFTGLKARGGMAIQTKKGSLDAALSNTILFDFNGNAIMEAGNLIMGKGGTTSGTARGSYINTIGQIWNAQPNGGAAQYFQNSANGATIGSITHGSASVAYNTTSDERLKDDLQEFDGLALVKLIDVWDYQWKGTKDRALGVIAQELHKVVPSAVAVGGDDPATEPWAVDYSKLVPVLIDAIQRLELRVSELEG